MPNIHLDASIPPLFHHPLMAVIIGRNLLLIFSFSWCLLTCSSYSNTVTDTILHGQELRDWQQLVSAHGVFRLVFFSFDKSKKRYLGISYNETGSASDIENVVWVANRNNPILDTSGTLTIDSHGNLEILSGGSSFIILNPVQPSRNTSATLLDNGNLVLRELNSNGSTGEILWQSFDYPTDTLLPGMKLGINYRTGHTWSLTSWRSSKSPASGSFTFGLDPNGTSQLVILWRDGTYWTSGPWHNGSFEHMSVSSYESKPEFKFFSDENEKYFTFSVNESFTQKRYMISPRGYMSPFGYCLYPSDEMTPGCTNKKLPECRNSYYHLLNDFVIESGYMSRRGFVSPDSDNLSSFDCQAKCLDDCSCVAYASTNIVEDTGCEIWSQRFVFTSNAWSERKIARLLPEGVPNEASKIVVSKWWIWLSTGAGGVLILLLSCSLCYLGWKKQKLQEENKRQQELLLELGAATNPFVRYSTAKKLENDGKKSNELQLFSFRSITTATNNFSNENKLGQGGFGPVYKGKLLDGQEIAIKRLSRSSGQGLIEFKNEIILIAKLQHNNLVRLLGCCIEGEEKMLIYEYLPNKSLDFFLFDPNKKYMLDWKKRYNIIEGIAQGLLYLHKYSRLTVVHRDLKASNILLDDDMNPKISDFGMARIFDRNEFEANTNKIVGTYGYMSPEYAMEGIFSTKSDVFSFGVLLLEIVCSKKNYSSHHHERPLNLIGYAWELWKEGRALEIIDQTLGDLCPNDVLRCIHVGLLCVQENPADRPSMSDVVSMFTNEILQLSVPSQPAFFIGRSSLEPGISRNELENFSVNNASISEMEAR